MATLFRILKYVKPSAKWAFAALGLMIVATVIDLIAPWVLRKIFDDGIAQKDMGMVLLLTLSLLVMQGLKSLGSFAQGYTQEMVGQNVVFTLRKEMYAHLQRLSFKYYDKAQTGQLMSRMTGDIEAVKNFVGFGAMMLITGIATFVGTLIFMLSMQAELTLLSLSTIPPLLLVMWLFNRKVGPAWGNIREQMGRLTATLQENISGIRVVKAFARETKEQGKFADRNEQNFGTNMYRAKLEATAFPLMGFFGGLTFLIMIWLGAVYVAREQMSLGTFMAFQWYTWGLIWPLNMLGWQINIFQQALKAAPRVFEVLDTKVDIESPAGGGVEAGRIRGAITFDNVSFAFDNAAAAAEEPTHVLHNIQLQVKQGQVIAVLGATGSGKSSLIALLSRYYDTSAGTVLIDGVDVKDYNLEGLRQSIGIVPQETFLFSATIRENVAFGNPNATQEMVEAAARKAQIHDFIVQMPYGYETLIGERGVGLSGGQRQRVALARAILMDPPILVLDEATASVDTATESAIHEALLEVMKGRTTFIIAQRLSTVRRADRIIVLDNGRIVQAGTQRELLEQDGFFRRLLEQQETAAASNL
ncbi:ABC transporter ATP-binding protein [Paenibacillus sp. MMS18-CY102]|uniref:ABC transporter ATP-binding protein n=1 Tax=Paenibacillus sp. MMS18-CY102 TaxID=2682849 RepID=UPI0013657DE8|nr:ABC transporter ATP-binding protein [Paenibacillus sp. MMS18-CY102]MWC28228.1 ATP-binding cassette domain-containing protein [Paenibacillus sp. MMS18-CY102]